MNVTTVNYYYIKKRPRKTPLCLRSLVHAERGDGTPRGKVCNQRGAAGEGERAPVPQQGGPLWQPFGGSQWVCGLGKEQQHQLPA